MVKVLPQKKNSFIKEHEGTPYDFVALHQREVAKEQLNAQVKHNEQVMENFNQKQKKEAVNQSVVSIQAFNAVKAGAYNRVADELPNSFLSEAFNHIYIDSLPHDQEFVNENYKSFRIMGEFYMRKLGGMKFLKQRVAEAHSPYLTKFYQICEAAAKKAVKDRMDKIGQAVSEEEISELIQTRPSDEEREEMIKNIDQLGTDELTELIKHKVVSAVQDETRREKDDREQRTILKDDLIDDKAVEKSDADEETSDVDMEEDNKKDTEKSAKDAEKGMEDEEIPSEEGEDKDEKKSKKKEKDEEPSDDDKKGKKASKKDKEEDVPEEPKEDKKSKKDDEPPADDMPDMGDEPAADDKKEKKSKKKDDKKDDEEPKKKKGAKESFYGDMSLDEALEKWDPFTRTFTHREKPPTLLEAMCRTIFADMMRDAVSDGKAKRSYAREDLSDSFIDANPLNLDVFDRYLQDKSDIMSDIETSMTSAPKIIGRNVPVISKKSVLTEALVQYTLFETANTMRMIHITPKIVREQVDYLMAQLKD